MAATVFTRFRECYPVDCVREQPRGICVILTISKLSGTDHIYHRCAESDVRYLQELFTKLNFIVKVHANPNRKEMEETMGMYSRIDHTNFHSFIGIIMVPGDDPYHIYGSDDEPAETCSLLNAFNHNTTLNAKPKVFLIQTYCIQPHPTPSQNVHLQFPCDPDLLIAHINIIGEQLQTTFIREFQMEMQNHANNKEIVQVLRDAKEAVAKHRIVSKNRSSRFAEFEIITNTLKKSVYFPFPGNNPPQRATPPLGRIDPEYPMNKLIRGYCICINNLPTCDTHIQHLGHLFESDLAFHTQIYCNLSAGAIKSLLQAASDTDHTDFNCFLFAMFCPGNIANKAVFGCDQQMLTIPEVEHYFTNHNCVTLSSKPKIFFFHLEVARQSRLDEERAQPTARLLFDEEEDPGCQDINETADIFRVVYTFQRKSEPVFVPEFVKAVRQEGGITAEHILRTANAVVCTSQIKRQLKLTVQELSTDEENTVIMSAKFRMAQRIWDLMRKKAITELQQKKLELVRIARNVRISRIAGASTAIGGGVVATVGFGLIPVTLGGSLALSIIGGVIAGLGGAASIGATITNKVLERAGLKDVNNLLAIDEQLGRLMQKMYQQLEEAALNQVALQPAKSKEERMFGIFHTGEMLLRFGSLSAKGSVIGVEIAGLGGISALEGGIFVARITSVALTSVAVVGGVLNAALIPISAVEIAYQAYQIANKKDTKAIELIQQKLDELEKMRIDVNDYFNHEVLVPADIRVQETNDHA